MNYNKARAVINRVMQEGGISSNAHIAKISIAQTLGTMAKNIAGQQCRNHA